MTPHRRPEGAPESAAPQFAARSAAPRSADTAGERHDETEQGFVLAACPNEQPGHEHPQVDSGLGFTVDAGIFTLLERLWALKVETVCSCEGSRNVRHGWFSRRHDHPAFITTARLQHAATIIEVLTQLQVGSMLDVNLHPSHEQLDVEYTVEFGWDAHLAKKVVTA